MEYKILKKLCRLIPKPEESLHEFSELSSINPCHPWSSSSQKNRFSKKEAEKFQLIVAKRAADVRIVTN